MDIRPVAINTPGGTITIGNHTGNLALFAGPCVIENEEITRDIAAAVKEICSRLAVPLVFKASFDKANRSSLDSFRGPGMREGLAILGRIKNDFQLPVVADIHEPAQADLAAEVLDVLQIPAFLCRQTDLLAAAAATGKPVNVKKGQFVSPWDMANVVEKLAKSGCHDILLTERGATFGYNNLAVDMRSLPVMRGLGCPVVFDATHSVQLPGGRGKSSGGDRSFIPVLARAAVAAGVDGLFMEVHPDPDQALCDGANSWPLDRLEALLTTLTRFHRLRQETDRSHGFS